MTYASTVHPDPAATVPSITGIIQRIRAAAVEAHRRSVARRQCRQLFEVQDHLLRDIGLSRSDVRRAMRRGDAL